VHFQALRGRHPCESQAVRLLREHNRAACLLERGVVQWISGELSVHIQGTKLPQVVSRSTREPGCGNVGPRYPPPILRDGFGDKSLIILNVKRYL
jgi:hypothetical protein